MTYAIVEMHKRTVAVKTLAVVALVFTILAADGWLVFLGGFGYLTANRPDLDLSGTGQPQSFFVHPITRCSLFIPVANSSEFLDRSVITGPCWDPYWVVSVLSPILLIVLIVNSILMIIKHVLFRKFFIIHILAMIAFIITVVVLCFLGYLLVQLRVTIHGRNKRIELQPSTTPVPGYINAIFAGVLLETIFLTAAWICHILAFLFGGTGARKSSSD